MANEISVAAKLNIAKNGTSATGTKTATLSLAGTAYQSAPFTAGTTTAVLSVGELSDIRYAYFHNPSESQTQTVTLTLASVLLRPGDVAVFPPGTALITAQATANSTILNNVITEA